MTSKRIASLSIIFIFICKLNAQDLTDLAIQFLETLTPELRSEAHFSLEDPERFNMNYVPIERKSPSFRDLNAIQKKAALKLLRASLSQEGYKKTTEIIALENVLIKIENNRMKMSDGSPMRDPLNYHFCVFGDPSPEGFWGWRFEGHHISLNFISTKDQLVSSTPSFFGSNPAIANVSGMDSKEVLKLEADLGFLLVNSLTPKQLALAKYAETAPWEILTRNEKKVTKNLPEGLSYSMLTKSQQTIFMNLLNVYIDNYELGFAESFRKKINRAGIDNLSFAWAGSLQPGKGHYYRIQGPMLLIEYDNTQNNANHIHTVVRDLTNDFGEDVLKEHYLTDHKK